MPTTTATTPVAAEIDRIMNKAVNDGIALANLIESLKAVYQPNGEPVFRPASETLQTLRMLKASLKLSIEAIENIA